MVEEEGCLVVATPRETSLNRRSQHHDHTHPFNRGNWQVASRDPWTIYVRKTPSMYERTAAAAALAAWVGLVGCLAHR
ncbi:hypothetical protein SK128_019103, partial [Halocaridina rubra]